LAALGTLVAWTPALAQTGDIPPAVDVRHITINPQVTTTYDTNVAGTNAAGAAARGISPEDVYVTPSVAIDALAPVARETVFLTGSVGYDFYDRNTVLNRERINLAGGVAAQLARCQPRLRGSYSISQSRLAELLPAPGQTSSSPQNAETSASVGIDLACPRPQGFSPNLSVTHAVFENSSKIYKPTDNSSNSVQGGISYARPGFGAIQAFGSYTSVAYDNPFLVPFGPFLLELNNDYKLYSGGVRYDRPVGGRLNGTISVSYTSLDPQLSLTRGFNGVTYTGELAYRVSSRFHLHALVTRAMLPTNQVGAAYMIEDTRQLDASYNIGARLKLSVGGFDQPQSYRGGIASEAPQLLTNGRVDRVFGSLNMALNRRLNVSLDVADEHRDSNVALYSYTSQRVSLTLKSVF
jgi:hypothetical protein